MRILIIGGTRFVGRHMAEAAVDRGHEVTLFHRGSTEPDTLAGCEHVLGDRDRDLDRLDGRSWDATIDVCAYVPRQVSDLLDVLGDRAGHFTFISTVSVYAEPAPPDLDEDAPRATLADPTTEVVDDQTYGGLKVLCEDVVTKRLGDSAFIVRPTYVVGPHDHTRRFTYWVERIAAGGEVLAPEPRDYQIQVIDGRDQAAWVIDVVERGAGGTFHTVTPEPPFSFSDMLNAIVDAVGPDGTTLTWVDGAFLAERGVSDEDLPLWDNPKPGDPGLSCNPARAYAAGLHPRPLAQTIRELLAAERDRTTPGDPGLSRDREVALLKEWAGR